MKADKAKGEKTPAGALRIFRNREYSRYFAGQLISQVGTWMQQIAISWLTYKLTNSAFLLAVVAVSGQLPALLVMPFAGTVADRVNRHHLVVAIQVCAMLQAAILAYLTLMHQVQVWSLILLGIAMGIITAFDMPTRGAFVIDMVKDKDDLPAAIGINAGLSTLSRLLGPALAGFVVAALGEGVCFSINAVSYVAVIIALLSIRGNFDPPKKERSVSVLSEFAEGIRYAMRTTPIRAPLIALAFFSFGAMAFTQLLPVFVKQIGGTANTLGYLCSATAVGSVVGSVILASRKSVVGMGRIAIASYFTYAVVLFLFGFATSLWCALPLLIILGTAMMLQMGCCNTILQAVVDPDKRGRIMGLFSMAFIGVVPLGALAAGAIANKYGFQIMIFVSSVYCLLVAIVFAIRLPRVRRDSIAIYVERGLIASEGTLDTAMRPSA
jgi:MFS family permease